MYALSSESLSTKFRVLGLNNFNVCRRIHWQEAGQKIDMMFGEWVFPETTGQTLHDELMGPVHRD